jgi:RNA polymerase sigma-70 factor (ECF subfamily)
MSLVRNSEWSADAVQSAFLTLWEKWNHILPEHREGWLVKAVQLNALAIRRREGQRASNQLDWAEIADCRWTGTEHSSELVDQQQLHNALRRLPVEQMQVVHLRLVDGLTFQQVADELQIPLGTALSRMRLALDKLRSELLSPIDEI